MIDTRPINSILAAPEDEVMTAYIGEIAYVQVASTVTRSRHA